MASSTTTAPPARLSVDSGRTHLPLCSCPLAWRGVPTPSLVTAWRQAMEHEKREHPGQQQAAKSYAAAKRRQAAES